MTSDEARLKELVSFIPRKNGWTAPRYPQFKNYVYRGKKQWVATYGHSRLNSHHANGLVYDVVIGWGETKGAALERAAVRVAKKSLKEKK